MGVYTRRYCSPDFGNVAPRLKQQQTCLQVLVSRLVMTLKKCTQRSTRPRPSQDTNTLFLNSIAKMMDLKLQKWQRQTRRRKATMTLLVLFPLTMSGIYSMTSHLSPHLKQSYLSFMASTGIQCEKEDDLCFNFHRP